MPKTPRLAAAAAEALENRAMLAIDTVVPQTYLDANNDLMVQSAAGAGGGGGSVNGTNYAQSTVTAFSDRDTSTTLGNEIYRRVFVNGVASASAADRVNLTTSDAQMGPDVAVDPTGAHVVVWQSRNQDGSGWGIYARVYSVATIGQPAVEIQVNQTTAGNQVTPKVAMDASGNFVVTWVNADTGNGEIYARRFSPTGSPLGSEFKVSGTTSDGYSAPDVAMLPTGEFAIVWTRTLRSGDNTADVQMQVYNNAGNNTGSTVLVNLETAGDQAEPTIAAVGGRFVVAWSDNSSGTAAILFRVFNAAATPVTSPEQASQDSNGNRSRPKVAGDADGNFTIGWTRQESGAFYSGADFRSFDATYRPTSNETTVGDGSSAARFSISFRPARARSATSSTIGEFMGYGVPVSTSLRNVILLDGTGGDDSVVVYDLNTTTLRTQINNLKVDYRRSAYAGVRATLGDGSDSWFGEDTSMNVTVDGGAGNDSIYAGSGDDSIDAGSGEDLIFGNAGNDTIDGGAGKDDIRGNAGNDSLRGGDGADLIDGGDGDDYAIGDGGDDTMYGGAGGDIMTGGGGKNRLYGGDGNDRLNGGGGRDYLFGEGGDDRLYGNGGSDDLDGGGNVDKLYGGDGDDFLVGGSSNDRLFGQAGNDTLSGGKGNDYLDGDTGIDTVLGKEPGDTLVSIEIS